MPKRWGQNAPVKHAIRNSAQRSAQARVRAQRKAKRDAHAAAAVVHPPQDEIEQDIAPEALEGSQDDEMETIASTSRRGRARGRSRVARGRSRLGRS